MEKKIRCIEEKNHIKKGYLSLDVGLNEHFSLIEELKESHAVTLVCDVFEVHRSSYKYWRKCERKLSPEKIQLIGEVRAAHEESNGSAGARTIADIVTTRGIPLSRYHAGRLRLIIVSLVLPVIKIWWLMPTG